VRWGRGTDLTISAVQAADPWLHRSSPHLLREGLIAQPVIRFTGERDEARCLKDGFLTSFVNLSLVLRVGDQRGFVALVDHLIGALSSIGIHAGRLTVHSDLSVGARGPIRHLPFFFRCDDIEIGDAVLLWREPDTDVFLTDIGLGAERVAWVLNRGSWSTAAFGGLGELIGTEVLDAVRTGTLLLLGGIREGPRGAGYALRRTVRRIPPEMACSGLGRLVRIQHRYWCRLGCRGPDWPQISQSLEEMAVRSYPSRDPAQVSR
jgi:hypothetical protein